MLVRRLEALRRALLPFNAPAAPDTGPPGQSAEHAAVQEPAPAAGYSVIHKGAYVVVRLYVEGNQPPAQDFAETARRAAEQIVAGGAAAIAPLTVTVKRIDIDDDPPD